MLMDKRLSKEVPVFTLLPRLEAKEKKYIKGQIKLKADFRAVYSPKKQTNELVLFVFLLFTAK